MERERAFSAKSVKSRPLTSRVKDQTNTELPFKNKTFKSKARQVWMANLLARQRTTSSSMNSKTQEKKENSSLNSDSDTRRPPSVKRKGTPEIFPMSTEMKKTLLLLGNLDFLPEEERLQQVAVNGGEKKSSVNKFRLKTKQRIIQPQRFLRGMRASTVNKQSTLKEEILIDDKLVTTDDLIDSTTRNLDDSKQEETATQNTETGSLPEEDENKKREPLNREREVKTARVFTPRSSHAMNNAWGKSFQKYQTVFTISNPTSKTYSNTSFDLKRSRKIHLSSKTWQPDSHFHWRNYPMRRAMSLGYDINPEDDNVDNIDLTRDGRSIDEITSDIQLRCSKWFEFRQKILKQKDIKKKTSFE